MILPTKRDSGQAAALSALAPKKGVEDNMKDLFEIFSKRENHLLIPYSIIRVFLVLSISKAILAYQESYDLVSLISSYLKDFTFFIDDYEINGIKITAFVISIIIVYNLPLFESVYISVIGIIDRLRLGGTVKTARERQEIDEYIKTMTASEKESVTKENIIIMDILRDLCRILLFIVFYVYNSYFSIAAALLVNYLIISRVNIHEYYINAAAKKG